MDGNHRHSTYSLKLQSLLEFKQINPTAEDCEDLGLDASQLASNPRVFSLTGFVSRCEHGVGRGANDRQYIFINKRPCDMPKLTRLVNEVYHVFNRNQYPFAVLNIDLRKDLVDVNVTPDKRQVFLQQEKLLLATVKSSLKAMYDPSTSTYEINQKPFTQIKLPFNKRSNDEEGSQSGFSKSIKDKLLRAAKVSKASSILNFTTKTREVSKSVEDEPDRTSDMKTIRNALSPGSTEKSLDSGTLASTETGLGLVNVSEAKHDQACVLLTDASEKACEKACEKDLKMESATSHHTVKDGCSDFNANLENVEEYAMDNLERSQNVWNRSVDTTEHFSYSQEGNRQNLPEINVLRKPREQSLGEDAESPEMCKVEGLKNAVDGVNESNIVELTKMQEKTSREAVKDENYTVFEEQTDRSITNHDTYPARESKRNRNDEASDSPRVSKKIRLDESCTKAAESRKSIKVNFDVQKLREKFTGRKATATVAEDTSGYARTFRATIAPENNQRAEEELERHITKEMFKKMEIIGQFNQGFIITKLGDDLFIVDQHASDEKYNFEEQQKNTVIKSQRLIHPQSLDLTAINESILMDNLEVFRKNGFDFDIDKEAAVSQRVKLVSLPVSKNWSFGKSDVHELIFMLSDSPSVNYRPSNVRKMFASRACRMSVMVGTALNEGQMRRVVAHMGDMEHPWNCPHGRPTMRHLINLNMVRK